MYVYLHGFNSSPASYKARLLCEYLQALGRGDEFVAPLLHHRPGQAIATVERMLRALPLERITLIGSSLGGHYATWIAERFGVRAVLVNPAIRPHVLLGGYLGAQTNLYSGEHYELTQAHLDELHALEVSRITRPERYLLVVALGDEVLDSRIAMEKYRGAAQIVHSGGDHGFAEFARYLDQVVGFGG